MRSRPLLFFILVHAAIFLALFVLLSQLFYPAPSDLERDFGLKILSGMMPYRDFPAEYPPLGLVTFLLPAIFFKEHLSYALGLAGEMLLLDIAAMYLLSVLAPRFKMAVRDTLGIYTLFILAVGPLVVIRYDLLPGLLMLLAVWAFTSARKEIAWGALGLGVMAKIFPAVLAPVFAIYELRQRNYAALIKGGALFVGVVAVIALPWYIIDSSGFISMLTYHTQRGLHWESTYASVLLIGHALGLVPVSGDLTFGSWNMVSPPVANYLSQASMYITIGLLLVLYIRYSRLLWRKPGLIDGGDEGAGMVIRYSVLAVLVFLLTSKVFSPQFLIWLCPLLPLAGGKRLVALLFIIAGLITQVLFPYNYIPLELGETYAVALLAVRNLLMVLVAVLLVRPVPLGAWQQASETARLNGRR